MQPVNALQEPTALTESSLCSGCGPCRRWLLPKKVSSVILGIVAANQASKAIKHSASSSGLAALNWLLDKCVVILLLPEVIA